MKTIRPNELYRSVGAFLKKKGIELTDGPAPNAVKTSCEVLADAINISQRGLQRTKEKIDQNLELLRQAIHEMTAPRPSRPAAQAGPAASPPPASPPSEPSVAANSGSAPKSARRPASKTKPGAKPAPKRPRRSKPPSMR